MPKSEAPLPLKNAGEVNQALHKIVDQLLEPFERRGPRNMLVFQDAAPPFDISRPNIHDTKQEFLAENEVVSRAAEYLDGLIDLFLGQSERSLEGDALDRLTTDLATKIRVAAPPAPAETTANLIRRNIAESGGFYTSLWVAVDLRNAIQARLAELAVQEDKFWNVPHRPPDYYARAIASRLAKHFASETGQRPTSGSTPETGGPSTGFGRALADIFAVLGITAGHRSHAD